MMTSFVEVFMASVAIVTFGLFVIIAVLFIMTAFKMIRERSGKDHV